MSTINMNYSKSSFQRIARRNIQASHKMKKYRYGRRADQAAPLKHHHVPLYKKGQEIERFNMPNISSSSAQKYGLKRVYDNINNKKSHKF